MYKYLYVLKTYVYSRKLYKLQDTILDQIHTLEILEVMILVYRL